jgi:Mg-chelatase subunit ChlD
MKITFEEIHKHLVETTNSTDAYISSYTNMLLSNGFKEGDVIEKLVKNLDSMGDVEQSVSAIKYTGFLYMSTFYLMMKFLTAKKAEFDTTEIVFILDKSGSMGDIRSDAIGGFNSFLEDQKKVKGKTNMTLVLFESGLTTLVEGMDINEVAELNSDSYKPWGGTALIDAIGTSIDKFNKRISEQVKQPDNVIFVIMTDGEENMSRSYSSEQVKNKIVNMQNSKYQFIFLGANIDSVNTAKSFGIKADFAGDFLAKGNGASMAMLHAGEMVTSYRSMGKMSSYNEVVDLGTQTARTSLDISEALKKVAERAKEEE